ncbi:MAG TPA: type II toxin-antitoxin system VapC family toxin [Rhizomicrobium sp.]|jgi:ribonuclease VapC|nr:type II toxin-antitoxin system VapC family toxin [Rhizomicrobium sp.]
MILDSSAIIAILQQEHDAENFADAIDAAATRRISAATYLEAAIVIDSKRQPAASLKLDDLLQRTSTAVVAVDEAQARIAREAYRKFGKGSGHKAKLNFGDCLAYALAKATGEPLLYKGRDFSHTDVASALK